MQYIIFKELNLQLQNFLNILRYYCFYVTVKINDRKLNNRKLIANDIEKKNM